MRKTKNTERTLQHGREKLEECRAAESHCDAADRIDEVKAGSYRHGEERRGEWSGMDMADRWGWTGIGDARTE